jgi:hypothetical protein
MRRSLALALALAACGGKSGTISLSLVVSPADNPFSQAANVRFTLPTDQCAMKTPTVQTDAIKNGTVDVSFDQSPDSNCIVPILVELLDAGGTSIAWGMTPALQLAPVDQPGSGAAIRVFIARPGTVLPAPDSMKSPRTEFATAYVTQLGAVFFGGRTTDGSVLPDVALYSIYSHSIVDEADQIPWLAQARADGVAVSATGYKAIVFGGSQAGGIGMHGMPLASAEIFDSGLASVANPSVGAISGDTVDARSAPNVSVFGNGSLMVAGGADGNGAPLSSALVISTDTSPRVTAIGAMQAPRLGAACAPAKFPDADGVVCFGGLVVGSVQPVAERLTGTSFAAYDMNMPKNRVGAIATPLGDGRVLFTGGHDDTGTTLDSAFVIQPTLPATVMAVPALLSTPRDGHSATRLPNGDVLVCGGGPAGGMPSQSCDLIDGVALQRKATVMLGTPRRDHAAVLLETGNVLIAGGTGSDGKPLQQLEIFTPAFDKVQL